MCPINETKDVITMRLNKIKGKIVEQGKKTADLAEYMGITPQTLSKKLNGKIRFNVDDAKKICDFLNITDDSEKTEIFLT